MAELVMRLPAITTEMDEGRLLTWMVAVGQAVKEGDPICEFTTDKVDTELESPYTGTITKLLVPEGGTARVGDAIALIEGDAPNFLGDLDASFNPGLGNESDDTADPEPVDDGLVVETEDEGTEPGVVPAPRAIRLEAERRGIDLTAVVATGSRGQVTMADLDAFSAAQAEIADAPGAGQVAMDDGSTDGAADFESEDAPAVMDADATDPEDGEPELASTAGEESATALTAADDAPVAVTSPNEAEDGEPSRIAQRPQERRGRRAERTGGRRRGRRRQETPAVDQPVSSESVHDASVSALAADTLASEPVAAVPPAAALVDPDEERTSVTPVVTAPPVVHEVRVESAPPFTLYGQLDVTDFYRGNESGLSLLSRLVWAYGQALWEQPEANAMWDHQDQSAVSLDTVYVDLGIETVASTMETVPIAVPKDAPIAQIGLSVTNAYGLVRQGTPPEVHVPQRSATLIDLGPWRVERFTPVIQPPQVTALSVGEIQTVPRLVGRTVTIRQLVTIGITIDTRVLDPVQAASLLATIIDHATRGDGLDQPV